MRNRVHVLSRRPDRGLQTPPSSRSGVLHDDSRTKPCPKTRPRRSHHCFLSENPNWRKSSLTKTERQHVRDMFMWVWFPWDPEDHPWVSTLLPCRLYRRVAQDEWDVPSLSKFTNWVCFGDPFGVYVFRFVHLGFLLSVSYNGFMVWMLYWMLMLGFGLVCLTFFHISLGKNSNVWCGMRFSLLCSCKVCMNK